jgi:hypothetical protein
MTTLPEHATNPLAKAHRLLGEGRRLRQAIVRSLAGNHGQIHFSVTRGSLETLAAFLGENDMALTNYGIALTAAETVIKAKDAAIAALAAQVAALQAKETTPDDDAALATLTADPDVTAAIAALTAPPAAAPATTVTSGAGTDSVTGGAATPAPTATA